MNLRLPRFLIKLLTRIRNPYVVDEHFVPKLGLELEPYLARNDRTAVHHLIRYRWAGEVLAAGTGPRLLDVACGEGYGSYLLASRFPEVNVTGADYDRRAVARASATYRLPNVSFRFGDVLDWEGTIGTEAFDCIVSFDTIEHVPHREVMLENLVSHLKPTGALLLSTPCGHPANVLHPRWPNHRIEYSASSLFDFLSRYFKEILRPEDANFPGLGVFRLLDASPIDYLLQMNPVICRQPIVISNPYKSPRPPEGAHAG